VLSAALALGVGQLAAGPWVEQIRSADRQPLAAGSATGSMKSPHDAGAIDELSKLLADGGAKLEELESLVGKVTALGEELTTVRGENQRLTAEMQADHAAHERAGETAQARIAELSHALDEAKSRDERHAQQLAEMQEANAALTADLTRSSTQRDKAEAQAEHMRADLSARIDQLMADAKSSAANARRVEEELDGTKASLAIATDARSRAEVGAANLQLALEGMSSEAAVLREQLAAIAERLNKTEGAVFFLEQERKELVDQVRVERAEAERLKGQLASARQELGEREAAYSSLENRLASFETSAATATDAATQTLHAVEARLSSFSSVLSTGEAAEGSTKGLAASTDQDGKAKPSRSDRPNRPIPETDIRDPAPAAGPDRATADEFAMLVMPGRAMGGSKSRTTANLAIEHQIQAKNLLVDLDAQPDSEGIKVIVPGTELFASNNSNAVQDAAHARLAQAAELIQLYEQREVLVIGHTDAAGDQKDNMKLSQRRAEAVKQFLIDHFDIEASRLSSRGLGENRPIASNATANGREANRRVELIILN
jgi:outer membrane protein OmpA-like peptidoglycan-associated protein